MITKETITKEVYILNIGKYKIQLSDFLKMVLICITVFLAYNIGMNDSMQFLKFSSYLGNGHLDASGHIIKCYPYQEGNTLDWKCIDTGGMINLNNTINK